MGVRWGFHEFQFWEVPLFDWGLHKNMKIWKMFVDLIFFGDNDKVLKHVFSIENEKLSI